MALSPGGLFYAVTPSIRKFDSLGDLSPSSTPDKLDLIDPSLGVDSQIGIAGTNLKDTSGNLLYEKLITLTFGPNNQLYALGSTEAEVSKLFQIDVNTKVATLVTTFPKDFSIGRSLVYDEPNNRFLAMSYYSILWQIPLANPAGATKIGSGLSTNINGLAFENGQLIGFASTRGGIVKLKINLDDLSLYGFETQIQKINNVFGYGASTIPTNFTGITTATRNDFNGDGRSDILWRNDYGSVALWQMNGVTVTSGSLTSVPNIDPSWKVAGTGDFNGDWKTDILWRNTNGSAAVWTMDGSTVVSSNLTSTPSLDNSWKTFGTGDYNGDGKADILWRNDDGRVALWQMNGAAITSSSLTSTPSRDSSQTIAGIGDYNGDGKADILWRKDSGAIEVWQMNGATVISSTLTSVAADSSNWKIAAPII